jgi:hypothetical protein
MKYTILAAASAVLCLGSAFGAGINATNLAIGPGDTIVTDNAGNAVVTHSFLSTFGGLAGVSDVPGLISAVSDPGYTSIGDPNAYLGTGEPGLFLASYNDVGGNGEPIYLILADGPDPSAASWVGLINIGETLDADAASPDSNNYVLGDPKGAAQVGAFDGALVLADWSTSGGFVNEGPSFQLGLVPEPSSSLLAGLAALGLLIRRKR